MPLDLEAHGISKLIFEHFGLKAKKPQLSPWKDLVKALKNGHKKITVALVGKYTAHGDAYISVHEALKSAAAWWWVKLSIIDIDSEKLEKKDKKEWQRLESVQGVVVPGGFGERGIEGKIMASEYCRIWP
ncbi:MAG: CTP synthase [Parcubacteria group bacterium GW2011_GWB1_43_66]|nr:MAG: CTP synthase [Parcubacteria group bacterium GW2011_GWB1_43_66]